MTLPKNILPVSNSAQYSGEVGGGRVAGDPVSPVWRSFDAFRCVPRELQARAVGLFTEDVPAVTAADWQALA
jgi:hypothetical protein